MTFCASNPANRYPQIWFSKFDTKATGNIKTKIVSLKFLHPSFHQLERGGGEGGTTRFENASFFHIMFYAEIFSQLEQKGKTRFENASSFYIIVVLRRN